MLSPGIEPGPRPFQGHALPVAPREHRQVRGVPTWFAVPPRRGPQGCRTPHALPARQSRTPVTCGPKSGAGNRTRCILLPKQAGQPAPRPGRARPCGDLRRRPGSYAIHCAVLNTQDHRHAGVEQGRPELNPQPLVWRPELFLLSYAPKCEMPPCPAIRGGGVRVALGARYVRHLPGSADSARYMGRPQQGKPT